MKEEFNWKSLAIVLIVICVLETTAFIGLIIAGSNMMKEEERCGNICYEEEQAYYYDSIEKICYCVDNQGEEHSTHYF